MTTAELNQAAALLGTADKNTVFAMCIKTLVEAGIPVRDAVNHVLGEGRYEEIADKLYDQFRSK